MTDKEREAIARLIRAVDALEARARASGDDFTTWAEERELLFARDALWAQLITDEWFRVGAER